MLQGNKWLKKMEEKPIIVDPSSENYMKEIEKAIN